MTRALRNLVANMDISREEESINMRFPFRNRGFRGPKCFWMFEDKTIEEDAMVLSISSTSFSITVLPIEWRNGFPATLKGVWRRHTSQRNPPHHPSGRIQTFSGMKGR